MMGSPAVLNSVWKKLRENEQNPRYFVISNLVPWADNGHQPEACHLSRHKLMSALSGRHESVPSSAGQRFAKCSGGLRRCRAGWEPQCKKSPASQTLCIGVQGFASFPQDTCIVYVRGTHTDTQDAGNGGVHLQLQDEREGKRQEYRREHELRMRAQKANKSGHEYQSMANVL